jgi:non-ribosomal peptide synthetase component F
MVSTSKSLIVRYISTHTYDFHAVLYVSMVQFDNRFLGTTYHILVPGGLARVPPMTPGELCLGGAQLAEG